MLGISFIALLLLVALLVGVLADWHWLRYIYFLRVPALGLAVLVIFPFAARNSDLLGNLLVVQWRGFLAFTYFSLMFCWVAGFATGLTWKLGPERFGEPTPHVPALWTSNVAAFNSRLPSWLRSEAPTPGRPEAVPLHKVLLFTLFAGPILGVALVESLRVHLPKTSWWVLATYIGAGALGLGAALAGLWIIHKSRERLLTSGLLERFAQTLRPLFSRFAGLRPGYVDAELNLRPGHGLAVVVALFVTSLYLGAALLLGPDRPPAWQLPTLPYLLILGTMSVAALAGATFFFDRYRFPALALLLALVLALGTVRDIDYTFRLWRPSDPTPPTIGPPDHQASPATPAEVLESRVRRLGQAGATGKPTLVVVAAAGGGIQAAAWTARVLTGLQAELGPEFARSIGLLSGVSGGSIGIMYYAGSFSDGAAPEPKNFDAVVQAASASSLAATIWAAVFNDIPRLVLPVALTGHKDRGWAMEYSWAQSWRQMIESSRPRDSTPKQELPRMSEWIVDTKLGSRPAIIMNSMVAESASRLLLGSTSIPNLASDSQSLQQYCCAGQPAADIDVVTAARVSATFPYVTPMARPLWDDGQSLEPYALPDLRTADGGYYDNFAILSAAEWLTSAIESHSGAFDTVLFLEINAFPAHAEPAEGLTGLVAETFGPLTALLEARTTVQRARNRFALEQLAAAVEERHATDFDLIELRPSSLISVLSWHLSPAQIDTLEADWASLRCTAAVQNLKGLFPESSNNQHSAAPCDP